MSPTPSITKMSILSSSSTSPLSNPNPNQPSTPRNHNHHCASSSPSYFPPSHPTRKLYLLARSASVLLALLQIILATIAFTLFSRRRWLDPTLSPAITTLIYSSIEIFSVLYWHARAHHYTRAFYDGGIAVGFTVAMGFMVRLALPSMRDGEGGEGAGVVGGIILIGMISQVIIHAAVSVAGVRDTLRVRREKREERNAEESA
ncbi:hypothetical protein B0T16DRAFT_497865 [Cercophora newfieldiana]|uniref:Uncharacterized protein n=1 Tax=Cercophora newfieldiana TaxID=92897 RepID=A0AA39XUZ9_9PEZI|nr:hypothetical protein B0T16DRAFT_497865 [Cercophora newfieldiana]